MGGRTRNNESELDRPMNLKRSNGDSKWKYSRQWVRERDIGPRTDVGPEPTPSGREPEGRSAPLEMTTPAGAQVPYVVEVWASAKASGKKGHKHGGSDSVSEPHAGARTASGNGSHWR